MNKTISLNQFPSQVENLLREISQGNESLVLEDDGKPVGAVVPMDEYLKLHPHEDEDAFSYELPTELLAAYHKLLDKKFSVGLTLQEDAKLTGLNEQLDDAEAAQPLVQLIRARAAAYDEKWIQTFQEAIAKLRELRENTETNPPAPEKIKRPIN